MSPQQAGTARGRLAVGEPIRPAHSRTDALGNREGPTLKKKASPVERDALRAWGCPQFSKETIRNYRPCFFRSTEHSFSQEQHTRFLEAWALRRWA